jgi:3-phosphoshikimate 1-carboxyvinyltransferase
MSVGVRIPGSKSITNRVLALAAISQGQSEFDAPLISDDTLAFARGLAALGYAVDTSSPETWIVTGAGRGPVGKGKVDCVDAGTAARFLPPLAAGGSGAFTFDGSDQLRRRPLRPLLDTLGQLGAVINASAGGGLPIEIRAAGLSGGQIHFEARESSQYLSGLLMAGPLMRSPLAVSVGSLVSRPYIEMTVRLMRAFGFEVSGPADLSEIAVKPTPGRAVHLRIEPDASAASYFFAAATLLDRSVRVDGIGHGSLQGDSRFVDLLHRMGAHVEQTETSTTVTGQGAIRGDFVADMGDISDTMMTLACLAPFADGPVRIVGVGHARAKESDRIGVVVANLRRLGVEVDEGQDWLVIHPGQPRSGVVACHRDHRIAMAFSVLALRANGVELDEPDCVTKTFPGFHRMLADFLADSR